MKHELNDSHLTRCVDLEAMLTEASTEETDIDSVLLRTYAGGRLLSGVDIPRLQVCRLPTFRLLAGTRRGLTAC